MPRTLAKSGVSALKFVICFGCGSADVSLKKDDGSLGTPPTGTTQTPDDRTRLDLSNLGTGGKSAFLLTEAGGVSPAVPSTLTGSIAAGGTWLGILATPAPQYGLALCATEGGVIAQTGGYRLTDARIRALAPTSTGENAQVWLRFLGPSAEQVQLESGEARVQIGLKLRAQDTCNTLYVMWRVVPVSEIVVSTKANPTAAVHSECGNAGYSEHAFIPVSPPELGEEHELMAGIQNSVLTVTLDQGLLWTGPVPSPAASFRGPAGIRSDNADWLLERFDAAEAESKSSGYDCPGD